MLKRYVCITFCSIHLLTLAVCTYIAANRIESILVTGWICSASGFALGVSAIVAQRYLLAAVGFLTPIIAVVLFVLEVKFLHLGPGRAALPFCIVFIVNQVLTTLVVLVQLSKIASPPETRTLQITIKTLIVSMVSFSIFFALTRYLLQRQHNWLMAVALGLLGLTFVGLTVVLYTAVSARARSKITT